MHVFYYSNCLRERSLRPIGRSRRARIPFAFRVARLLRRAIIGRCRTSADRTTSRICRCGTTTIRIRGGALTETRPLLLPRVTKRERAPYDVARYLSSQSAAARSAAPIVTNFPDARAISRGFQQRGERAAIALRDATRDACEITVK